MKNKILKNIKIGLALMVGVFSYGQVGIGTVSPNLSSDLDLATGNRALLLNRVASPENDIANPQSGMMVYDTTEHCVRTYGGNTPVWSDCLGGTSVGAITGLTCSGALINPSDAVKGGLYTGTLTVPYTGGNGGAYPAQSFTLNNMIFILPAGHFATGSGNLVYDIAGTPATAGTYSVSVTVAGFTCPAAGVLIIDTGG